MQALLDLEPDRPPPRARPSRRSRRVWTGWASTRSTSTSSTGPTEGRCGPGPGCRPPASAVTPARSASRTSASLTSSRCSPSPPRPPVINQVQFSPFEHRRALLETREARSVAVEAYSPLSTGRHLCGPTVAAAAERLARSPAQVLLRWCVRRRTIVRCRTSTHRERIHENAAIFDFSLSEADMASLDALDTTRATDNARERKWWRQARRPAPDAVLLSSSRNGSAATRVCPARAIVRPSGCAVIGLLALRS